MAVDPNVNLQELARILTMASRHTTSLSNAIKDAGDAIASFKSPLAKYDDFLAKYQKSTDAEIRKRAELLSNLKKHHEAAKKESDAKRREIAQLEADIKQTASARRRANAEVKRLIAKYGEFAEATEGPKEKAMELKNQLEGLRKKLKEAEGGYTTHSRRVDRLGKVVELREKELKGLSFKEVGKNIASAAGKTIKDGLTQMFSVAKFGDTVKGLYDTTHREIATGMEAARFGEDQDLLKLGATRAEALELYKTNRSAVLAAGGKKETNDVIAAMQQTVDHLMPFNQQFKYAADQMQLLTNAGIKPSTSNASLLTKAFTSLRKTAGMTGDEFNATMSDMVADSEIQSQLRTAGSQAERARILEGISLRIAENKQMGLSIEQSKAMIKANAKALNAPALERVGNAAKMQQLMGALGIGGGSEIAAIIRKGRRASPAELKQLDAVMSEVSKRAGESKVGDNLGTEILVDQLSKHLDTMGAADPNSAWNKEVAKAAEVTGKSIEGLGEVSDGLRDSIRSLDEVLKRFTGDPYIQMIASGTGGTISALGNSSLLEGVGMAAAGGWAWKKMRGGGGAPGSGAPAGAGGAPRLRMPPGKVMAGGIGGMLGGYALDSAAERAYGTGHTTTGNVLNVGSTALSGASMGAMVGSAVPVIGTAVGAAVGGLAGVIYGLWQNSNRSQTNAPTANQAMVSPMNDLQSSSYLADIATNTQKSAIQLATMNTFFGQIAQAAKDQTFVSPLSTSIQPRNGVALQNTAGAPNVDRDMFNAKQLERMETGNNYLRNISEAAPKLVELAEKQLTLLTYAEKDRADVATRMGIKKYDGFVPGYKYAR